MGVIKYNNEIQQPGKVIGHETTVCKMDDGQKRYGCAQPSSVPWLTLSCCASACSCMDTLAHSVVAGRARPDRYLFPDVFAQCVPPSAGKRCVSAPALQGDERVAPARSTAGISGVTTAFLNAPRAERVCVCRAARAKSTSSAASAAHRSSARPEATADVWICDRKSRGLDPAAERSL